METIPSDASELFVAPGGRLLTPLRKGLQRTLSTHAAATRTARPLEIVNDAC